MKNFFLLALMLFAGSLSAQIAFTNQTNLLNPEDHYSGVAIAVIDMNGDGRDDIVRMNEGTILSISFQGAPNSPFGYMMLQDIASNSQWGMCAGDLDNNGFPDVLAAGRYDGVKIAMADTLGTAYSLYTLSDPSTFAQCVNFSDVNNDGWLDAFVCHDDGPSRIFLNDSTGNLVYDADFMDFSTVPNSDGSGNYGSIWTDFDGDGDTDLYIAKCRQGVNNPGDGRRINMLYVNNGDGTYTQDTADVYKLRIGAQSWTADFGDIDNDGDFDCFITNHDVPSMLLENDGSGHFTDISDTSGVAAGIGGLPIQGVLRDLDNDGYLDIIVAGSEHYVMINNGDKTFSAVPNPFDDNDMESYAIGDLNSDGFLDVYGGYANIYTTPSNTPDALWINEGNDNNYFGLTLRGQESNYNAVGAKAIVYSPLGTQIREVRSGESYGINNSLQLHFGMGQEETVDSLIIYWPSGQIDSLFDLEANQYLTVSEGGCVVPSIGLDIMGETTFCPGDSAILIAPLGYSYLWTTGDTTQQITGTESGQYAVTVTSPDGCSAVSQAVALVVDPVQTPVITATGDTSFCEGAEVVLSSSEGNAYMWSTGDTTQSITVSEAGSYSVSTLGLCNYYESDAINVQVFSAGDPMPVPDTIFTDSIATLTATGDSLLWFDSEMGGMPIGSGPTFITPPLSETTTYWVQSIADFDQPNVFLGPTQHQGSAYAGSQFNAGIIFDCHMPVNLAGVKVITEFAGVRRIVLEDSDGNILDSVSINIPSGETVLNLDFELPFGEDFVLTTDTDVNQTTFGVNSPQLRRSDQGISYPYEVPGVLTISESTIGGATRYYYFYEWELDFNGFVCEGELVPVTVVVDSLTSNTNTADLSSGFEVYPNPGSGIFQFKLENISSKDFQVEVFNAQGQLIRTEQLSTTAQSTFVLDLQGKKAGMYWVVLKSGEQILRKRIVLE